MSNSPVTTPQPATPIEKTTTVESTLPTPVEGAVPAEQATGESQGEASEAVGAVAPSGDSRITKMLERIEGLSKDEQETVRESLETELPLSAPWTLYFSDTATTKKSSHAATEEQYTQSQTPLFTVSSVPALCGSLKAYKRLISSKRQGSDETMGLAGFRPGQNLHFFREGISPTWEDAMNEKGGRLTISPPLAIFDLVYESLVLLLAGSSLEAGASERLNPAGTDPKKPEGIVTGVVASRRARGDRIELWLGGREERTPPPNEWIEQLKDALGDELDMPDLKKGKYKRHF